MVKGKTSIKKKTSPSARKTKGTKPAPAKGARPSATRARSAAKPAKKARVSASESAPARSAGKSAELQERLDLLLQEKTEMQNILRRLKAERDSALAEGTRLEERASELEAANANKAAGGLPQAGPGEFDPAVDMEEEGSALADDELEGAAGFFDRIEELRARRIELDRERNDRELEQSEQAFWMICPKCGDSMEELEAESVKVERCDNCGGLYLDRGEVDLLLSLTTDREGQRRIHNILKF